LNGTEIGLESIGIVYVMDC